MVSHDTGINIGTIITMYCNVSRTNLGITAYRWIRNDTNTLLGSTNTLTLILSRMQDFGAYRCEVTNAAYLTGSGNVTIEPGYKQLTISHVLITLVLMWLVFPPCSSIIILLSLLVVFVTIYESPMDITVLSPEAAVLYCPASGEPLPEIAWIKEFANGSVTIIGDFASITEIINPLNKTSILTIEPTSAQDTANYSCRVQNQQYSLTSRKAQVIVLNKSELT